MTTVEWESLARVVGAIDEDGNEIGGDHLARCALILILGADGIHSAIDHCLTHAPGSELARSVLQYLRPESVTEQCEARLLAIGDDDVEARRNIVELMRAIPTRSLLEILPKLLRDADDQVRVLGVLAMHELILYGVAQAPDLSPLLAQAETDPVQDVREACVGVRDLLHRI